MSGLDHQPQPSATSCSLLHPSATMVLSVPGGPCHVMLCTSALSTAPWTDSWVPALPCSQMQLWLRLAAAKKKEELSMELGQKGSCHLI